jgi:predicted transcriptional regulator YdeE
MIEQGFKIIGISVRTTNKDNQSAHDIGALWEKFFSQNIFEKIPNKLSTEIFSIYTEYESDFTGAYTTFLGVPVTSLDCVPEGLEGRGFPEAHFQKFTAQGDMPEAVLKTWISIWSDDKNLKRAYTHDVEVYGEKSRQGPSSEVDIYIAIK